MKKIKDLNIDGYTFSNYEGPYYHIITPSGNVVRNILVRDLLVHNTLEMIWVNKDGSLEVGPVYCEDYSIREFLSTI
jgi:hypothetical protein